MIANQLPSCAARFLAGYMPIRATSPAGWSTCCARQPDFIAKVRRNMKPVQHTPFDQALLKRRSLIETVFDELKNPCQIEHTRHRSHANFIVNLMSSIVAYCLMPNKPQLSISSCAPTCR